MRALRYSLRNLARNPAFSAVIVLLLAFGIGANTLIFTAVDVLLLRDLPVEHPEQLARMESVYPSGFRSIVPGFPEPFRPLLREHARSLRDVFTAIDEEFSLEISGRTESVMAFKVSGNFYSALGVRPHLGRLIADDDDRPGTTYPVVLSYAFWQRAFAGRASVLGEKVRLRGVPFTIVGVAPRGFRHLAVEGAPEVVIPAAAEDLWSIGADMDRETQIFVRVRPEVSIVQASAEVESLHPGLVDEAYNRVQLSTRLTEEQKQSYIASQKRNRAVLEPISRGISRLRKQFALAVQVLMGAVGALLLLVCANIAGLMLARGEAARKDIAVRLSLGATRFTVAWQLIVDALVLSILGAAGAMIVTRWGGPLLIAFLPARRPQTLELIPDGRVLAFAAGACVVTALAMSIVPALHLFRADLASLMGRGGPRQRRSRAGIALVALQVALSAVLLAGGGALVRTLHQLRSADLGVDRRNLVVVMVNPATAGVKFGDEAGLVDQIVRRAKTLDGVEGVSVTSYPQMRGIGPKTTVQPTGTPIRDADFLNTTFNSVSLNHFQNAGMRILAGRDFQLSDVTPKKPREAIVSQSFARKFFPRTDPIGRTFGQGMNKTASADYVVVGVVNDVRFRSMREESPPIFYQVTDKFFDFALYVRTNRAPGPVIAGLRAMLASAGPGLAPSEVGTMEQDIETSLWQERLIAAIASVFAAASAVLIAIGLHGMLAYSIARRTREIGIRMALGARPGHLVEMISWDVLLSVVPGIVIGLAAYAASSRVISPVLYGVRPMDAISIAIAIGLIALVATVAAFIPARRAISIEPAEALRQE
ncbi:MAG TPA: ABC transporter permease [Bryobacteraceae bacterium]|nr:ABC transporter permease [Bryobacteraceae bacterium]